LNTEDESLSVKFRELALDTYVICLQIRNAPHETQKLNNPNPAPRNSFAKSTVHLLFHCSRANELPGATTGTIMSREPLHLNLT